MRAVFVESSEFTQWVSAFLPDDAYVKPQQELMDNSQKGRAIPGCGGLRKVRIADPKRRKGKRGGARVIYLYVPEARWFFLLDVFGKDEKDDLTPTEKKQLRRLVETLKKEAKDAIVGQRRKHD